MHITTTTLQSYAAKRLADLRRRSTVYLWQAMARGGDVRNLTLGSMIDTLSDEAAEVYRIIVDLCALESDQAAVAAVEADYYGTRDTLNRQALDCRMAGLYPFDPATRTALERVPQ